MFRKVLKVLTSLIAIVILIGTSLPSYAWVNVSGGDANSKAVQDEYAIITTDQGWLLYVIDTSGNTVSDVSLLFPSLTIQYKFMSADYNRLGTTRYGSSVSNMYLFSDWNALVGSGSIPLPFNSTTEASNYAEMRQYIGANLKRITQVLNTTGDIDAHPENYYLIFEPVYLWSLYSRIAGVEKETIAGSTYQYSKYITENLIQIKPRIFTKAISRLLARILGFCAENTYITVSTVDLV